MDALRILLPGNATTLSATDRPSVIVHGVLAGGKIRGLLQSAFPARLQFHLELYKKNRWIDDLKGTTDWDVLVAFDLATHRYSVRRLHDQQSDDLGTFTTLDEAAAAVERPYVPAPIGRLERGNSYYYAARLEVTTLDMSDLEAVQRWLSGEAKPAIQGKHSPLTALRAGLETAISRVIGGDRRTYPASSAVFKVE